MTERLNHNLNVDTIKTIKDVKNIFDTMELVASMDVDNPKYEIAKEYFTIPYVAPELKFPAPRRSIEEITQELDEKIDALIKTTKEKFEYSKEVAKKRYKYEFDKIFERFEYAKDNGHFPLKLTFNCDGNISLGTSYPTANLEITSNFVIKSTPMGAGYWDVKPNIQIWLKVKPNWLVRKCAKIFFDFGWKDAK